ncbi:MAG: MiaB/RimO family radical SAM methylthiotransferase, partial [bacterium]
NTCAFIKPAKDEAVKTLKEMAKWKKKGKCKHLIAAGCLPERYKEELPALLPEVDAFIGVPKEFQVPKIKATPSWTAYLKISEGCNNCCTYCTVPSIRGRLRHKKPADIVNEAKLLVKTGVKEIILVAEETTMYPNFPKLLKKLCKIPKLRWIRIMYAHPKHVSAEMIAVMAKEPKIVKYLDLPIQHASDKILRLMNRRYTRQDLVELIDKIRRKIPQIALRTSVIVGFPGENEAEFQELLAFIKQVKFQKLGVFTYSQEEGTPASKMRGQVSAKIKSKRFQQVMQAQNKISKELNEKMVGLTLETIIEGANIGRSYMDAPDIDGQVIINSTKSLSPGEIKQVRITGSRAYDLIGLPTGRQVC